MPLGLDLSNVIRAEEVHETGQVVKLSFHPGFSPLRREEGDKSRLEIRTKLAREAEARAGHAQAQCDALLKASREQAEEIVRTARSEAQATRQAAETERQRIHDEARQAGLEQARAEARQEALGAVDAAIKKLDEIAAKLREERAAFLRDAVTGMADLVSAVAERLLRGPVEFDRDLVRRTLAAAVDQVAAADRITIKVHPDDLVSADEYREEILARVQGLTQIDFIADAGFMRGGVLIETDFGRVDARLETQLAELLRSLRLSLAQANPAVGEKTE